LFCSTLNLGFRLDVLFGVPSIRFLASRRFATALVLCWPQTFKELALNSLHNPVFPSRLAGAKVQPFHKLATYFFKNFSFLFYLTDCQSENFSKQG
jgi:hypothetical protein